MSNLTKGKFSISQLRQPPNFQKWSKILSVSKEKKVKSRELHNVEATSKVVVEGRE